MPCNIRTSRPYVSFGCSSSVGYKKYSWRFSFFIYRNISSSPFASFRKYFVFFSFCFGTNEKRIIFKTIICIVTSSYVWDNFYRCCVCVCLTSWFNNNIIKITISIIIHSCKYTMRKNIYQNLPPKRILIQFSKNEKNNQQQQTYREIKESYVCIHRMVLYRRRHFFFSKMSAYNKQHLLHTIIFHFSYP